MNGYKIFEINSGMKRSKQNLFEKVGELIETHQIQGSSRREPSKKRKRISNIPDSSFVKTLIVLDEVDTVFEDEHLFLKGVQSILQRSKHPVILISNGLLLIHSIFL